MTCFDKISIAQANASHHRAVNGDGTLDEKRRLMLDAARLLYKAARHEPKARLRVRLFIRSAFVCANALAWEPAVRVSENVDLGMVEKEEKGLLQGIFALFKRRAKADRQRRRKEEQARIAANPDRRAAVAAGVRSRIVADSLDRLRAMMSNAEVKQS